MFHVNHENIQPPQTTKRILEMDENKHMLLFQYDISPQQASFLISFLKILRAQKFPLNMKLEVRFDLQKNQNEHKQNFFIIHYVE